MQRKLKSLRKNLNKNIKWRKNRKKRTGTGLSLINSAKIRSKKILSTRLEYKKKTKTKTWSKSWRSMIKLNNKGLNISKREKKILRKSNRK